MSSFFINSKNRNPYFHLAMEQILFEENLKRVNSDDCGTKALQDKSVFSCMIWENDHSAVIGRFQNPWAECDLASMERNGFLLARRMSGGGAVLHGPGNLNFSMIGSHSSFSLASYLSDFLKTLSVDTEISEKKDLIWKGLKLSGSASKKSRGIELQHCTLLVDFDRSLFHQYLTPRSDSFKGKYVRSIPSATITMGEILGEVSVGSLGLAFGKYLKEERDIPFLFYSDEEMMQQFDLNDFQQRVKELSSVNWLYKKTPPFAKRVSLIENDILLDLELTVKQGICSSVHSIGEDRHPFFDAFISDLEKTLSSILYHSNEMRDALLIRLKELEDSADNGSASCDHWISLYQQLVFHFFKEAGN